MSARHQADNQLDQSACGRFKSEDPSARKKAAIGFVTTSMKGNNVFVWIVKSNNLKKETVGKKAHKKRSGFGIGIVSQVRITLRKTKCHKVGDSRKTLHLRRLENLCRMQVENVILAYQVLYCFQKYVLTLLPTSAELAALDNLSNTQQE